MAISHELSSEIATALFAARDRSPRELNDLKEIVFKIHSALQQLTDKSRKARAAHMALATDSMHPSDAEARSVPESKSAGIG